MSIKQGTYYNIFKKLWLKLDYHQNFKMECSEDAAMLQKFVERERILQLLVRLNVDYDQVRVHILGKETLPSLTGVSPLQG